MARSVPSRRAQRAAARRRRERLRVAAGAGAVALVAIVVVVVVVVSGGGDDEPAARVELFEWGIAGDLEVPGGQVRLAVTNIGEVPHNVGIRGGPITAELASGESTELDLGTLAPGTYELYCDIVGHVDAGMVADFVVSGDAAVTG